VSDEIDQVPPPLTTSMATTNTFHILCACYSVNNENDQTHSARFGGKCSKTMLYICPVKGCDIKVCSKHMKMAKAYQKTMSGVKKNVGHSIQCA
jgi:hypothetical protein